MNRKKRSGTVVLSLVLLTGIGIVVYGNHCEKDFRSEAGFLREVRIRPVSDDSLFQKSWLTLGNGRGLTAECGILVPRTARDDTARYPAVILAGGLRTGKHAIDYAFDIRNAIIVSPDYLYQPREQYDVGDFLGDIPAMRRAFIDMVPGIMLVAEYLRRRPDVDTTKLVMIGYSFGAPLVPAVIAADNAFAAAVMVYGGGDVASLIEHNVTRNRNALQGRVAGMLGGFLLCPIEPMRYIDRISPVPLIMVNGLDDEQIPRRNAEMLFEKARQPKHMVWIASRHVHVADVGLTRKIIRTLSDELVRMKVFDRHVVAADTVG